MSNLQMTSFNTILNKSYSSSMQLEWDVQESSGKDGFQVIKKNTCLSPEGTLLKGTFRCYKCGTSGTRKRGTPKTDCQFKLNFRRQNRSGTYHFPPNHHLIHNHPMDPASKRSRNNFNGNSDF